MTKVLGTEIGKAAAKQDKSTLSGLSRRHVLAGLMGSAVAGATMGGLLIPAGAAYAQDATPKRGGHLKAAVSAGSSAETMDPATLGSGTDYVRGNCFYNGLTAIDEKQTASAQLATEWASKDNNTVWVFKLREGVTFHDGADFTSADVVYSLMRHKNPEVGSKGKTVTDQIVNVEASGKYEVTITLVGPNGDLPVLLGTPHMMIIKDGTTDFSSANGTGPFKQASFTPGVSFLGQRNESYWKDGHPFVDSVEVFAIAEENARLNALLSGDVHMAAIINPRSIPQMQSNPNIVLFETKGGTYSNLIMRQDSTPMNNPDFVLGMKHLINRGAARNVVFRDYAVIANDHPIDPSNPFFNADIPQREFDPEKAKFHFEKAGVLGQKIPMIVAETARASVEMGTMLHEEGREIGLDIDLQRAPNDGYWSNVWLKAPMHFGTISARPTADLLMSLLYKSDAAWNEAGWNKPLFDQLVVAARAETDFDKRKQMYGDMQVMIHEEGGTVIPLFFSNLDAHHSSVKGMVPNPTGNLMGNQFADYVWLDV